jgi:hypothetical protein
MAVPTTPAFSGLAERHRRKLRVHPLATASRAKRCPVRCKAAINSEMTRALNANQQVEEWAPENDAAFKSRLRWPCRFQSDAEPEAISSEVMAAHLPEVFAKGLGIDVG